MQRRANVIETWSANGLFTTASALLKNAELGNLEMYRQRLKQIAERYPETEAGRKAAELLE